MSESSTKEKLPVRDSIRERLKDTFSHYLKNLDEKGFIPRDENGVLHALSIGCGFAYDAEPTLTVFHNSTYKGIDLKKEIISARMMNRQLSPDLFVEEDAGILDDSEKEKYGLVIIRHPQVGGSTGEALQRVQDWVKDKKSAEIRTVPYWEEIFKSSIAKISPDGYIFVTTDSYDEKQRITTTLEENKISVLVNGTNNGSEIDTGPHKDSFVVIGKKSKQKMSQQPTVTI